MNYEEERNGLLKCFLILSGLILALFTAFDIIGIIPLVSDSLKLAGTVLCFLFSVVLLFQLGGEADRVLLMLSILPAIAADALLLFTKYYFWGILVFCIVQEFHTIRILLIKKSIVRMDGRITLNYQNYKVWKHVVAANFIPALAAAVPAVISIFINIPQVELVCVCAFYLTEFIGNLIRLAKVSRDVRLLDDMRPLRLYFAGMLLYFACDLLVGFCRLPDYVSELGELKMYSSYAMLAVWPLYIVGLVCITLSGNRRQSFYS